MKFIKKKKHLVIDWLIFKFFLINLSYNIHIFIDPNAAFLYIF